MKKCPVCGVMMGDNVARCSMCKYDFSKADYIQDKSNNITEETKTKFSWSSFLLGLGIGLIILIVILLIK